MGWSVTNWATNPDWASAALLNEFVDAVNERITALCIGTPVAAVVAGDDVQKVGAAPLGPPGPIRACQEAVEAMFTYFVRSHDAGVKRSLDHWDGGAAAVGEGYGDFITLFAAAGLSTTHWRRYVDAPASEGGTPLTGLQAIGDIIGPWLFEDLQKILNVLIWLTGCEAASGENGLLYYGQGLEASWADAKAAAEAAWADTEWGSTSSSALAGGQYPVYPGPKYGATIFRYAQKMKVLDGADTSMVRRVAWYAKTTAGGVWDANGDDVQENLWSNWLTENYAIGVDAVTTVTLGAFMTKPTWCADPLVPGGTGRGYLASSPYRANIISWDVAGGFVYR